MNSANNPDRRVVDEARIDRLINRVLIAGVLLSALLLVASIIAALAHRQPLPETALAFRDVLPEVRHLGAAGLASLGLLVLVATPIARVIGALVAWLVQRELRFALVAATVLAMMALSLLLGIT